MGSCNGAPPALGEQVSPKGWGFCVADTCLLYVFTLDSDYTLTSPPSLGCTGLNATHVPS